MKPLSTELIEKAKNAQSAQDLIALAKDENMELTLEQATEYMKVLHPPMGEIEDGDLDNVAGGACYIGDNRLIVTVNHTCKYWKCEKCGGHKKMVTVYKEDRYGGERYQCNDCYTYPCKCKNCSYMSYEKAMWLCNHPLNKG